MPSLATRSYVRLPGDAFSLGINARHVLHTGQPSQSAKVLKGKLPDVDIHLSGDLVLSFSGVLNQTNIPAACLQKSWSLQHMLDYFKNARFLFSSAFFC